MADTQISKYAGRGVDTIKSSASIPYIRVLQSNSAELDRTKKGHELKKIEGAKAGDLFHQQLNILKQPLEILIVKFDTHYQERSDMTQNARVLGTHGLDIVNSPLYRREKVEKDGKTYYQESIVVEGVDQSGRPVKATHPLVLTILMGVILPEYNNAPALIQFQSTGLSKARALQAAITRYRYPNNPFASPPPFARSYILKTVPEQNAKGGWMAMDFAVGRIYDENVAADDSVMKIADNLVDENLLLKAASDEKDADVSEDETPDLNQKPF